MGDSIPVPAATGNENQTAVPDDDRVCHLNYEVRSLADDSPVASYPYKVTVEGKDIEGETDGSGVFRVDMLLADDYLVQFGDTPMWLNAFSRDEDKRVVILFVPDGAASGTADASSGTTDPPTSSPAPASGGGQ